MKKMFALLMALLLVLSLAACGSTDAFAEATTEPTISTTAEPFDIEEYKNIVSDCVADINEGAVVLHNIVNFEYKYIKAYKNISGASAKPDIETVVETGIKGIEEYSDYTEEFVKNQYEEISAVYKDIVLCDADNAEVNEIKTTFKELHEAYVSLYNLAFSPSLDMNALASRHDEYTNAIKNCTSTLDILLS